ncbi:MAG: histidine ammonia-lyase [Acholeplasmataceae bacterium]
MITLDGKSLTLEQLVSIARFNEKVEIAQESQKKVIEAAAFVKEIAENDLPVYGINTGFGQLANIKIKKTEVNQLQINLLISHACGMGDILEIEKVRAMMALRINALIQGYSGLRLETILKMVEFLNKGITPVVFEKGSLGASGDLALLSHMSLPLVGLGEVFYQNKRYKAEEGLKLAGIKPLDNLVAKEGLSLINGTQAMNAIGALTLYDGLRVLDFANVSYALSMEALLGVTDALDDKVHQIRNQKGQIEMAKIMRAHLKGSTYTTKKHNERVQDAYSLRCSPQVHGASKDALDHILDIVEREMNAVTDNPLIFLKEKEAISAGNFHGQALALAFDYLGIALAELANISERRIERLVNPNLSNGLPAFLAKDPGLNSGFMIVQYTAAALVSENKVLAHPASVDSIPSSANQEDHVSMGSISARKASSILDHTRKVIALEFLTAIQGIDFRAKMTLGQTTKKAYEYFRKEIPFLVNDTVMYPLMHQAEALLKDNNFYQAVVKGAMIND